MKTSMFEDSGYRFSVKPVPNDSPGVHKISAKESVAIKSLLRNYNHIKQYEKDSLDFQMIQFSYCVGFMLSRGVRPPRADYLAAIMVFRMKFK